MVPVSDAGGAGFISSAISAALLGIEHEFVSGYSGSNETTAALLRDEIDVGDYELIQGQASMEAGELRALLRPIRTDASDALLAPISRRSPGSSRLQTRSVGDAQPTPGFAGPTARGRADCRERG